MEKIYYQEPYLKKIQCAVTGVKHTDRGTEVLTDRTVFYPEGGGQPGDCGTLGEWTVRDTRKADNGDSILILDGDCHVETNQNLELELDWKHRFRYMVLHTAQHLVSGLLYSQFGIGTVSVHLGDGFITIETDRAQIDGETTDRLVRIANEKIRENHRIIYREMSHAEAEALGLRRSIKVDGDVRIVEIEGVDRIACGGVHVGTTSEIGVIVFSGSENIRGHVRLVFECGEAAADRACERAMLLGSIAKNLSCSEAELPVKIHSLTDEIAQLKAALKTAQKKNALTEITSHLEGDVACFETDTDLVA
ncbi:MAG: alanyl-tRNA editing protein, partial [Sphaerochaetaceae bacterium]|nr:alanyl-tRNA editing protein [Sphaerochaetaceae bacterium]